MKCLKINYREYINDDNTKKLFIPAILSNYERRPIDYANIVNNLQLCNGIELIPNEVKPIEERIKLIQRSPKLMVGSGQLIDMLSFYVKKDDKEKLIYERNESEFVKHLTQEDYVYGFYATQCYLKMPNRSEFTKFLEKTHNKKEINFFIPIVTRIGIKFDSDIFLLSDLNKFKKN